MDVMIDLETWGTTQGCAIRSIGAVAFDPKGSGAGAKFYSNVDDRSCWVAGLRIDPKTARWWEGQPEEAKAALLPDRRSLSEVIHGFRKFYEQNRFEHVWCQGASFDAPILEAAARAVNMWAPWQYHKVRDTRTVYNLAGLDPSTIARVGTHHNAIDDCLHQVICVQTSLRMLGLNYATQAAQLAV